MAFPLETRANLPVANNFFTIEQIPQSHATSKVGVSLMDAIDTRLAANTTVDFPAVKRAILIYNDHASVDTYIRSLGANVDDRGIKLAPGDSLFISLVGSPDPDNEIVYQSVGGTSAFSVAVYF